MFRRRVLIAFMLYSALPLLQECTIIANTLVKKKNILVSNYNGDHGDQEEDADEIPNVLCDKKPLSAFCLVGMLHKFSNHSVSSKIHALTNSMRLLGENSCALLSIPSSKISNLLIPEDALSLVDLVDQKEMIHNVLYK